MPAVHPLVSVQFHDPSRTRAGAMHWDLADMRDRTHDGLGIRALYVQGLVHGALLHSVIPASTDHIPKSLQCGVSHALGWPSAGFFATNTRGGIGANRPKERPAYTEAQLSLDSARMSMKVPYGEC